MARNKTSTIDVDLYIYNSKVRESNVPHLAFPDFAVGRPCLCVCQGCADFDVQVTTFQAEANFNPIIDIISVAIKNSRQKLTGSLKNTIPINTVPTAPIPVHTA